MLISCPKCHSVYNISEDRIPGKGKKFKCAECGEIWKVFPQDVSFAKVENTVKTQQVAEEKEISQNDREIEEMLNRLSHGTKNLFANNGEVNQMSVVKRFKHRLYNFMSFTARIAFLLVVIVLLGILIAYNHRYEITARLPKMEQIYNKFNIESVYKAKNIVFRDVQLHKVDNDMVLISGRLYNTGKYKEEILPIKVTFFNKNGQPELEVTEKLSDQVLYPGFSILFNINADLIYSEIGKINLSMENLTE